MVKSFLIFLLALSLGVGAAFYIKAAPSQNSSSSNPVQFAAASKTSKTIRSIGTRETINYATYCDNSQTRCRCDRYLVTETVARPGIVTTSPEFDVGPRPQAGCPSSGGMQFGNAVPGQNGQCYVCPNGMSFSNNMRNGSDVEQRWGFGEPVCVSSKYVCE